LIPIFDTSAQTAKLQEQFKEALADVMLDGRYILGPNVQTFEKEIAALCGVTQGIGVASGTDALHLALKACGVGPGDEVITPSFTFIATAEAIAYCGATPIFVDIDPITFNVDPAQIAQKITARTKVIMPVHLFGQMADMDAIMGLAQEHGLQVVEDCAQAIGATYKGRPSGSFGAAGCFSFYPTKNLGAFGDGGMVVTADSTLAAHVCKLRAHGSNVRYYHDEVGFCSRLDEVQAAILRVKLPHLMNWNSRRVEIAQFYHEQFEHLPVQTPATAPGNTHTYHQYTLRVPDRDRLVKEMQAAGVGAMIYYPVPIHLQKAFQSFGYQSGDLPVSEKAAAEVLSLPIFPELTDAQAEQVADTLTTLLSKVTV
jgi:dTDP-4-amino-4,6-dideoxygalactose transaminase